MQRVYFAIHSSVRQQTADEGDDSCFSAGVPEQGITTQAAMPRAAGLGGRQGGRCPGSRFAEGHQRPSEVSATGVGVLLGDLDMGRAGQGTGVIGSNVG